MLFFERFMYIDGVTPINCIITARVRGSLSPENVRNALAKVQAKHPLLQARVTVEDGEPWFVFGSNVPEIPVRIVERQTADDWQAITEAEWTIPFDMKAGPLLRLVWIKSDEVSELMFIAHHCVCDGGSLITLMREVLEVTDKPETELIAYESYASFEDLVPTETLANSAIARSVKRKVALYKLFLNFVARRKPSLPESEPYVLYWLGGAETSGAISSRCKVEKTTPYAALCVAYLQAFREVQGKAARNKIMCPVDIRRLTPSVKADMLFSFAPTIALSLEKKQEADLWAQARRMKQSITEKMEQINVYEDLMVGDRMRSYVPKIVSFLQTSRGGHDVAFSNIGRIAIPAIHKTFRLEAILGTSVAVPWRNANTLVLSSFDGAMELAFLSNERFLPRCEASAIQGRALSLLEEALLLPASLGSGETIA